MSDILLHIDSKALLLINQDLAQSYTVLPRALNEDVLELYISKDLEPEEIQRELELILERPLAFIPEDTYNIEASISHYYRLNKNENNSETFLLDQIDPTQLREIVYKAAKDGASDIHFEALNETGLLRYRIDGILIEKVSFSVKDYLGLINQIKIQSGLDIAEKRLPQDGRWEFDYKSKSLSLRVSTLPTLHGEKAVLRILNKSTQNLDLRRLGLNREQYVLFKGAIQRPNGLILISGPTGSGKTTSLYAALKEINHPSKNILTIEDPVEYTLEGVNQVQLKESIGLDFPTALKTFLRQDPDIIMLGEIRDAKTAQMAIRASMTGHLVLSTIHTNSAIATLNRLLDLDVPSYLISGSLRLSIAQRLVRTLCENCKQIDEENELVKNFKELESSITYKSVGCDHCFQTGFRGRTAIYEILDLNKDNKEALQKREWEDFKLSGKSLASQALDLVKMGITTFKEVYTIIADNE